MTTGNAAQDARELGLWVRATPVLSSRRIIDLAERFGTLDAALSAPPQAGLSREECAQIDRDDELLERTLAWLDHPRNHLLTWNDAAYPALLREIPSPPALLHVCGDPEVLSLPQIAIVGSRNPTASGEQNATAFAEHLVRAGFVVTSGLALGIDACAHRGALAAGKTIAVVGTGLDRVYPARHRDLAQSIADAGALVSEFPLGTPPKAEHFPRRNRIISGLGMGVLVVEAAVQSGSLITARLAAEQGREVFAIPGSIHSPLSRGCHALIRQGAKLVETAQDILEELGWLRHFVPHAPTTQTECAEEEASSLLAHVGYDPIDVDTLVERSGLTADVVSSMLLQMELRGLISAFPGGKYQRTS